MNIAENELDKIVYKKFEYPINNSICIIQKTLGSVSDLPSNVETEIGWIIPKLFGNVYIAIGCTNTAYNNNRDCILRVYEGDTLIRESTVSPGDNENRTAGFNVSVKPYIKYLTTVQPSVKGFKAGSSFQAGVVDCNDRYIITDTEGL